MRELDLHQSQSIASQLDALYQEVGLDQSPPRKIEMLVGEVKEAVEAFDDYQQLRNIETKHHLMGELADVLFCVLSTMNDLGMDANLAMEYVFTKNFSRVNREHIADVRLRTGLDGEDLYKQAKSEV